MTAPPICALAGWRWKSVTDTIPGYLRAGQGTTLRDGSDVTIVAVGMMVQMALKAAELLKADGIDARVIDMHTSSPWMRPSSFRRPKRPALSSPPRNTMFWAVWARLWPVISPACALCLWCATV